MSNFPSALYSKIVEPYYDFRRFRHDCTNKSSKKKPLLRHVTHDPRVVVNLFLKKTTENPFKLNTVVRRDACVYIFLNPKIKQTAWSLALWSETFVAFSYNVRRHYAACLAHTFMPVVSHLFLALSQRSFIVVFLIFDPTAVRSSIERQRSSPQRWGLKTKKRPKICKKKKNPFKTFSYSHFNGPGERCTRNPNRTLSYSPVFSKRRQRRDR